MFMTVLENGLHNIQQAECQKAGSENEVVTTAVNMLTCTIFVMGVLDMGLHSASNEGIGDI